MFLLGKPYITLQKLKPNLALQILAAQVGLCSKGGRWLHPSSWLSPLATMTWKPLAPSKCYFSSEPTCPQQFIYATESSIEPAVHV